MKTASKVFAILGIVWNSFMALVWFITLCSNILYFAYFIPIALFLFSVTGIIVSSFSLSRLNSARTKRELTGTAVCCLILCNLVAGILMLCIKDADLTDNTNLNNLNAIENSIEKDADHNHLFRNNS